MIQGTEDWTLGVQPPWWGSPQAHRSHPRGQVGFKQARWCELKAGGKAPDPSLPTCPFQIASLLEGKPSLELADRTAKHSPSPNPMLATATAGRC